MKIKQPIVFISYSHLDEPDPLFKPNSEQWLSYVRSHLAPAAAHGKLELWDDRRIDGGGNWRTEINDRLERCAVCVFLISRYSLSSSFILDVEMKRMLERHHAGGAQIYPIVITSADLGSAPWLLELNLRPTNGTALELYAEGPRNKVMSDLAAEIRQIIERTAVDAETEQKIREVKESLTSQQETINKQQTTINNLVIYSLAELIYRELLWKIGHKEEVKSDHTADQQRWLTLLFDHGLLQAKDWNNWIPFDQIAVDQNLSEIFEPTPAAEYLMQLRGPPT